MKIRHQGLWKLNFLHKFNIGIWKHSPAWNPAIMHDFNLIENAIRPAAVGKKNRLFVGDTDADERGAILYTVIED